MTPEKLARLHVLCFSDAPPPWSAESFAALLAEPGVILETTDTGFALVRIAAGEAELLTLAVHPDTRRRGIGRLLMQRITEKLALHGALTLFCEVSEKNTAARTLYTGLGFSVVGRRRKYYGTGIDTRIDALVLQKSFVSTPLHRTRAH